MAQRYLTSDQAADALRDVLGLGTDAPLSCRVERVHARPGIDVSVLYRCQVASGQDENVVLTTANVAAHQVRTASGTWRGWRHPDDPQLVGLADACDASTVARWLGLSEVTLVMRSYRPLRRAVVRVNHGERTWYLKIVPPAKASGLIRRHQLIEGVGPRLLSVPAPGVLLTSANAGQSLAESYVAWHTDADRLPSPDSLVALLDRLPASVLRLPRRPAWCDRLGFYTAGARAAMPDRIAEITHFESLLDEVLASTPRGPRTPSHGDFYEANIFVTGDVATSLIDVDSLGPGYRVDDYACLLGHMAVLPELAPAHYPRLDEITTAWTRHFDRHVDPVALRARVAGVIASLIVGSARPRADHRLNLAAEWLSAALKLR